MGNTKSAPPWELGGIHANTFLPYTAEQYAKDVRHWLQGIGVDEAGQEPLLAIAIGGQARFTLEDLEGKIGDDCFVHFAGVDLIPRVLQLATLTDDEAAMLRTCLEFFNSSHMPGERLEVLLQCFDLQLQSAHEKAEMTFSIEFPCWMFLSVLRAPPKTLAEVLKECGHRMPKDVAEFSQVKRDILRERTFGPHVFDLCKGSSRKHAGAYSFVAEETMPLYICLGSPTLK